MEPGRPDNGQDIVKRLERQHGRRNGGLVRLRCFHPGYGYEDFLEGYRPHIHNGQVAFELRNGVLKKLCADAAKSPRLDQFLVIDQIMGSPLDQQSLCTTAFNQNPVLSASPYTTDKRKVSLQPKATRC